LPHGFLRFHQPKKETMVEKELVLAVKKEKLW
jgi:hypothetical protein